MPDLVADDNVYITYESSAAPEYGDRSRQSKPVPSTSTAPPAFVRRSSRGRTGCGGGGGGHNMEKGAWQHVFVLLISTNKCRKSHSRYLMLLNWKLPYVVFGVYYILIPICPCFCWFTVLQHACE